MNLLKCISPTELLALAIIISLIFICELDYDQQNVVGNFFIGLGGLIVIVASQGAYLAGLQNTQGRETDLKKQLSLLQEESSLIQGRLDQMHDLVNRKRN